MTTDQVTKLAESLDLTVIEAEPMQYAGREGFTIVLNVHGRARHQVYDACGQLAELVKMPIDFKRKGIMQR